MINKVRKYFADSDKSIIFVIQKWSRTCRIGKLIKLYEPRLRVAFMPVDYKGGGHSNPVYRSFVTPRVRLFLFLFFFRPTIHY